MSGTGMSLYVAIWSCDLSGQYTIRSHDLSGQCTILSYLLLYLLTLCTYSMYLLCVLTHQNLLTILWYWTTLFLSFAEKFMHILHRHLTYRLMWPATLITHNWYFIVYGWYMQLDLTVCVICSISWLYVELPSPCSLLYTIIMIYCRDDDEFSSKCGSLPKALSSSNVNIERSSSDRKILKRVSSGPQELHNSDICKPKVRWVFRIRGYDNDYICC